jgi:hypothetical protein
MRIPTCIKSPPSFFLHLIPHKGAKCKKGRIHREQIA